MGLREDLTSAQRAIPLQHTIDPGFVNHRRIQTILGPSAVSFLDAEVGRLPQMPDGLKQARIDGLYTQGILLWCSKYQVEPLQVLLSEKRGKIFCSTEELAPFPDVYTQPRGVGKWMGSTDCEVEIHYTTANVHSTTLRGELAKGGLFSIVGVLQEATKEKIVFEALVIGFPWLSGEGTELSESAMWLGREFFEVFVEDFDEFRKARSVSVPPDCEAMRSMSELQVKSAFSQILGDAKANDWGGEQSDYFSAHMHLGGRRVTSAFLFKGPARFAPMGLNHLGKNNDQIVRLSHEPADVLVVQHCHDILPAVRETLRAFAVQPSRPRYYCLIDGRDSIRLLRGYGFL